MSLSYIESLKWAFPEKKSVNPLDINGKLQGGRVK